MHHPKQPPGVNAHETFMLKAIAEAKKAAAKGEVPVGAVVVHEGKIIARAHNGRENKKNALRHAELDAIDKACKKLGGWRLFNCDLYVTLEPCPMCAGAILNARIRHLVFGAKDPKAGAMGSVFNLNDFPLNHKAMITAGVLEIECGQIITTFFQSLRLKKDTL
ncbi:MAG TPA: tRNA-specific adenosine deaminase [Clostridiales bacterium]|jgi:tRNA(adenine34) deaminase|nr:tRNA-specific adenosine deaminase [Clostridiales bacterium]HCG36410.1 tRNA-specific adenosine deaminase [Clostridiales bacterium]